MCRRSGCSGAPDKTEPWKRRFLQLRTSLRTRVFQQHLVFENYEHGKMRRRTHNRELAPIRENRIHCPELSTNTCVSVWLWVCVCVREERGAGGWAERERKRGREGEREEEREFCGVIPRTRHRCKTSSEIPLHQRDWTLSLWNLRLLANFRFFHVSPGFLIGSTAKV